VTIRAIVTDIEGTTSSIRFVHDVLFPYSRRALSGFVEAHRDDPVVRPWLRQVADEIDADTDSPEIVDTLLHWIDIDRKHPTLKALQGMIWASGYENAEFRGHVYPDVAAKLREWKRTDIDLYVYSSGSVAAQKLLFGHSESGDLTPLFSGYFDTEVGGKRETASYERILERIGRRGDEVLFLSDVIAELDAARAAGMQTCLLERDEPNPDRNGHAAANDFKAVALS
jgi:enolase-phosphatase E1